MSNETLKHIKNTIITVIITALIGGIGYVAWYASRVPDLEVTLTKHDSQLATISANLIFLMNQSGKPLEKNDLKELLSYIEESGDAKSNLIKSAEVIEGNGTISLVKWVPKENNKNLKVLLQPGLQTKDRKVIAKWITTATLADKETVWSANKEGLIANIKFGKIKMLTVKKLEPNALEKLVAELNVLSKGATELVYASSDDTP